MNRTGNYYVTDKWNVLIEGRVKPSRAKVFVDGKEVYVQKSGTSTFRTEEGEITLQQGAFYYTVPVKFVYQYPLQSVSVKAVLGNKSHDIELTIRRGLTNGEDFWGKEPWSNQKNIDKESYSGLPFYAFLTNLYLDITTLNKEYQKAEEMFSDIKSKEDLDKNTMSNLYLYMFEANNYFWRLGDYLDVLNKYYIKENDSREMSFAIVNWWSGAREMGYGLNNLVDFYNHNDETYLEEARIHLEKAGTLISSDKSIMQQVMEKNFTPKELEDFKKYE